MRRSKPLSREVPVAQLIFQKNVFSTNQFQVVHNVFSNKNIMSPSGGLQVKELIQALTELGGVASFKEIQERVTKNRNGDFSHYRNWENYEKTMRQILHRHCEDYAHFRGTILFEKKERGQFGFAGGSSSIVRGNKIPETISQSTTPVAADVAEPPPRLLTEIYRVLRDTKLSFEVKQVRRFQCQICNHPPLKLSDTRLYAEVHHIKPLGSPHFGPDIRENVLCVCPNCHVLLDYGAIFLDSQKLDAATSHVVGIDFVNYHNQKIFRKI